MLMRSERVLYGVEVLVHAGQAEIPVADDE